MSIQDYCGQHTNPHGYRDNAQHHGEHSKDMAQQSRHTAGRTPKSEDGQKYSDSYLNPTDQMYAYPNGIRKESYVGMQSGGEAASSCPAAPINAVVSTTVGAVDGDRIAKKHAIPPHMEGQKPGEQ